MKNYIVCVRPKIESTLLSFDSFDFSKLMMMMMMKWHLNLSPFHCYDKLQVVCYRYEQNMAMLCLTDIYLIGSLCNATFSIALTLIFYHSDTRLWCFNWIAFFVHPKTRIETKLQNIDVATATACFFLEV